MITPMLRCGEARPNASRMLICFPYAGGGPHLFRGWSAALPQAEVWAASLPGHPGRLNEPLATDIRALARAAADEIQQRIARTDLAPVVFGHSMGGWLALETTRELERRGGHVAALVVAARSGPGVPPDGPPMAGLPDDDFVRELGLRYGGLPVEVLASPEIMELFVPILRADIGMLERYEPGEQTVRCDIHALGGAADDTTTPAGLAAWANLTRGTFQSRCFPGAGHFFPDAAWPPLIDYMRGVLDNP